MFQHPSEIQGTIMECEIITAFFYALDIHVNYQFNYLSFRVNRKNG
jgi:hypothetical protein